MAIRTNNIGVYEDGLVTLYYKWDDVNLRLTAVGCINNSDKNYAAEAVIEADQPNAGRKQSAIFLAGTTTEQPIPTGAAQRIPVTINPRNGRIDGISINAGAI